MRDIKGNDTNKHFSEENSKREQVFCDPVHGQISFDSLCLKIIDTQEFQRLRFLKQLGFVYTVYPGATNNRFEHSLGVAYLSKQFLLELRNNQPDLDITDAEIRCVQIAGLCHDLGHGPFSHFWEIFMEKSKEKRKNETQKWKHEDASIKIFNYIVKKYNLADEFKKFGIDQHGIQFITDLIEGRTRDNKRAFLYQIVNNEDSGLDVDKWDYYLRDCHYLGIKCGFEYKRLMQFARVIEVNGKNIICFRDKVISSICGMFRTRSELHHAAYQHRMAKRIDLVFCDALIKADIDGIVHAPNGEPFKFYDWTKALTESAEITEEVMTKYCMLNDDIVYFALKYSNDTQIGKAIKMIETRFQDSKLYRTVARWKITDETEKDEVKRKLIQYIKRYPEKTREMGEPNQTGSNITCNGNFIIQNEVKEQLNGHLRESHSNEENKLQRQNISTEDFIIQCVSIDWGKGSRNPVEFVYFYSKENMDEAFLSEKEEWMIPKIFRDIQLSILCNQENAKTYENLKRMCENLDISSL
ncbi:deoxynucleoside triphosphate triphosphohydrolase SAMHD1-like isoform X2 [Centruroides sculpturatus]|uniref:deoxynucleoside triphosphate triphosphohydrolase SAMHD1-like isoform X1 n=1 Tax=Centruroides sculpturatus TaxID=218467 RepID=UPI000C6E5E81|nr:deoxynucleoside triphosphate triphosphohydrolase SAMHD1-like isoform X1 [Centruroides sculpturatus]XP_023213072.1 deoxynucleoside triphosphate triphosphohydrolase SAMHD1-like isoform X1 [Centruroides sculpturatus]XP_023213081.1 deoxynucleoside triphosphate triphosphohydrolase SAMHD1-like isoform X2 [Centruroides sculpturatus]XP_023213088.1 deoxynucleoside triphosphate triphosphohydrolase SAMHD1-like isoform X2 [Centruroides sculpturatus]